MTHLKKYWLWYLIAIIVVVAAILAYSNWETVKGWFSSTPDSGARSGSSGTGSSSKQACVSLGGDGCSYNGLYVPCAECTKRGIVVK